MNTIVAMFYLWKEQIKQLYAAGGTLIAVVASVVLVAVGLPLQISSHGGSWYIVAIAGVAGGLITTLIENLTVKGCAALRKIQQSMKDAKLKNAELKSRILLELEQQGLSPQLPATLAEAMAEAMAEAGKGQRVAYIYIALGVLASIAGNGLFWDAILGTLPLVYIIGVTLIFSFIIPTILIDSELRAELHKEIIEESMNSALSVTTAAQNADSRVNLHQRLHEEQQEHLNSNATKGVLQQAASSRMDGLLEEILGQDGAAQQYRTKSGRTGIIEARALQNLSLASGNTPLFLPAPVIPAAPDANTLAALQQVTASLQRLSQQQPKEDKEDLAALIEAGVQKALASQQKETGQGQDEETRQASVSPAPDAAGRDDDETEHPERLIPQLLAVLNTLLPQHENVDVSHISEDQKGQDKEAQIETTSPTLVGQNQDEETRSQEAAVSPATEEVTEPAPEEQSLPSMPQLTAEDLAALIEAGVQKALASQQQASVSFAAEKKKKPSYEAHCELIMQLLQEVEMPEEVRVSRVEAETGAARSTAHRWLVRARRELGQADVSTEVAAGQADVSLDEEVGQADVSDDDAQNAARLRIVRS
jgi:hypothetical protein